MKKYDAGVVDKLLPVLLSVGIVFGMVLLMGDFTSILDTREMVNQYARAQILQMEEQGYLTNLEAGKLKASLETECGLKEVSLEGSTVSPVAYGERICLVIHAVMKKEIRINFLFLYEGEKEWDVPIEVTYYSTAKN